MDIHKRRNCLVFVGVLLVSAGVGFATIMASSPMRSQRPIMATAGGSASVDGAIAAAVTNNNNDNNGRGLLSFGSQFQGYNCIDERWNHTTPMYKNTWVCSTTNSFVWGVSKMGNLVWKDLSTGEKKFYYKNVDSHTNSYFYLTLDGKFQVISDSGEVLWEKNPGIYGNIGYYTFLDVWACPYLHLHGDGVIVLNWIDATSDDWIA